MEQKNSSARFAFRVICGLGLVFVLMIVVANWAAADESKPREKIKPGETLAEFSYRIYGTHQLWQAIAEYNLIADPHQIPTGTAMVIPELNELKLSKRRLQYVKRVSFLPQVKEQAEKLLSSTSTRRQVDARSVGLTQKAAAVPRKTKIISAENHKPADQNIGGQAPFGISFDARAIVLTERPPERVITETEGALLLKTGEEFVSLHSREAESALQISDRVVATLSVSQSIHPLDIPEGEIQAFREMELIK